MLTKDGWRIVRQAVSIIDELEEAVRSGSSAKRVSTLRQVTDLFLHDGERLSEDQVKVFDDVLCHLVARVETRVDTPVGELSFEEYFVQRWYQDPVNSIRFAGIEKAEAAPDVIDAIMSATVVLLAPSNPVTSIGPILAVPGIVDALKQTRAPVAAVSPIIGSTAVSGPAGILMAAQGLPVSIAGVAQAYREFLDILVVDNRDAKAAEELKQSGLRVHCANTIMGTADEKIDLARQVLSLMSAESAAHAGSDLS